MSGVRKIFAASVLGATTSLMMLSPGLAADAAAPASKAPAAAKAPAAVSSPQVPKLSAAQVIEKHVAARGGAQTWKTVQSMQLSGKLDAGHGDSLARAEKMVNE